MSEMSAQFEEETKSFVRLHEFIFGEKPEYFMRVYKETTKENLVIDATYMFNNLHDNRGVMADYGPMNQRMIDTLTYTNVADIINLIQMSAAIFEVVKMSDECIHGHILIKKTPGYRGTKRSAFVEKIDLIHAIDLTDMDTIIKIVRSMLTGMVMLAINDQTSYDPLIVFNYPMRFDKDNIPDTSVVFKKLHDMMSSISIDMLRNKRFVALEFPKDPIESIQPMSDIQVTRISCANLGTFGQEYVKFLANILRQLNGIHGTPFVRSDPCKNYHDDYAYVCDSLHSFCRDIMFVHREGEPQPIGVLAYNCCYGNPSELMYLYIDEKARKQGYGSIALAHAVKDMEACGACLPFVFTRIYGPDKFITAQWLSRYGFMISYFQYAIDMTPEFINECRKVMV